MAAPRVFISSTFYDLRHIRDDLERFLRELGYEPVRNEAGAIPYGADDTLEGNAYREVELSDVIVAIIGGRYGTQSQEETDYSISQVELRRALERGIQVFIFIESGVYHEFSTYLVNKNTDGMNYRFVDDSKVYEFIEDLQKLPKNNAIATFQTSADITSYLKSQFAGLFQRFLQENKRASELRVLDEMKAVSGTLEKLVGFLTEERKNSDSAIQSILLSNHPAFRRFAEVTVTPYRVFFSTRQELEKWLAARGWRTLQDEPWDEDSQGEWTHPKRTGYLKLSEPIFDDEGHLKIYTEDQWDDSWVNFVVPPEHTDSDPDELPF